MLERKQNVFDDFLAAAEWLIANGYTRPERLGIRAARNGGLLVGAAVTQRPDLFSRRDLRACRCSTCSATTTSCAPGNWIPEYGSSDDPEQFDYLLALLALPQRQEGDDTRPRS